MITINNVIVRAGSRLLLNETSLRVGPRDKVGLVGRNGAGKTTLTKILAGETLPASGTVTRSGPIGYLPQDPRTGDLTQTARSRILAARGLEDAVELMRRAEAEMEEHGGSDSAALDKAMRRYARAETEYLAAGGYAASAEAAAVASGLGLGEAMLDQQLGTLSGGQRRRVELARLLFAGHDTLLLDEPTNHLDADSIVWLRGFLQDHSGGLIMISHDVELLDAVVNKVFALDANRQVIDVYAMGWQAFQKQRAVDERRRRREQANAVKTASALQSQAEKMRAKATKARAAQSMLRRAEGLLEGVEERAEDKVARLRFPDPAPCGKVPLTAAELSKSYGSAEIFAGVDLAIDKGSKVVVLGLNGAGKTTLLRLLAGVEDADTGRVIAGHGLKLGYYAQEHETLDHEATVLANLVHSSLQLSEQEARNVLGSFMFSGDTVLQRAGTLSGGEKTRLALAALVVSGANVLLLDEPTNNLDPASRAEILSALADYPGAVVLVTHDVGAVDALGPDRVLLLPDGAEDLWNDEYREIVELA